MCVAGGYKTVPFLMGGDEENSGGPKGNSGFLMPCRGGAGGGLRWSPQSLVGLQPSPNTALPSPHAWGGPECLRAVRQDKGLGHLLFWVEKPQIPATPQLCNVGRWG